METWKNRGLRRGLAFIIAFVMVIACLPVIALADEPAPEGSGVHVLEAKDLSTFNKGDKQDGDSEPYGKDSYFTLLWSKNSKVDSSSKTWDDDYASDQRINFGGKAGTDKNAVKFTTSGAATVKIWWVEGGNDNRQMAILDSTGSAVAKTTGNYEQNKAYLSTLEISDAGTYFLGGDAGNNYIFKVEVSESPSAETTNVLESNQLAAFDKNAKTDGQSEDYEPNPYFTLIWSSSSKVDNSTKTWADDYTSSQRINFGGSVSISKNAVKFTTSGAATVKVWWACGGDNRQIGILNSSGDSAAVTAESSKQNNAYLSTLELASAGTYFLGGSGGNNYIFKIEVTEGAAPRPPRAEWSTVETPEIVKVELDAEDPGKINVTVSGSVGYDFSDKISVTMLDEDEWLLKTESSLAEKDEHVVSFTPSASGKYFFEVSASRDKEDEIHIADGLKSIDFVLPLTAPVLKYVANAGGGALTVEWNPVDEATGYRVTAGDKTMDVTGTRADFTGFTAGEEVDVTVAALRGEETGPETTATCTVTEEAEVAWVFSAFGQSTDTKNNGYELTQDGVRVYSLGGKGKIQPAAQDGLAFYYTTVDPATTNFVLSATANVNSWTFNNGQEGFGLVVMDRVGVHGKTDPIFCNSYMNAVSGFSYTYDGVKINMKLGVGSLERSGVTDYSDTAPTTYKAEWRTLDFSGVGTDITNLVGNCTDPGKVPGKTMEPALTSFKLKIEKDDTGYHLSYVDHNGVLRQNDYDDPNALSYVDPYIYLGLFAARSFDVTFTDIEFTTSPAAGSSTPQPDDKEVIVHSYGFADPDVSNTADHDLIFDSNADGVLTVKDGSGKTLMRAAIEAGKRARIPVTLAEGANTFTATMRPDKNFAPGGVSLDSYASQSFTRTITFKADERTEIYVSPDGTDDAAGTKEDPTTLAAAVKCPAPGATIILMEGTYHYTSGVTVDRGINGTKEAPIVLMADPDAATRPVLDWGGQGNGFRLNANYWHVSGFDSTNSTAKGLHVGGSCNVVERINTYRNLNTGLSISRINFGSTIADWPSYNLILNCSSWLNADKGYEDADGFEAKLTCGVGNVFDGCIAAYNADDGWDLYARGAYIGAVTLKNCVAAKNGIDIIDGEEVTAGNGNGFKLGGNNYEVDHTIINSIAFSNKANGFTCNSNPNLKIVNCTAYNNGYGVDGDSKKKTTGNLSLYTTVGSLDTDFGVDGFISYMCGANDSIKAQGNQDRSKYLGDNNYYVGHISGRDVTDDWFVSVDANAAMNAASSVITRRADGSIDMHGFLELTDAAPENSGAAIPETSSKAEAPEPDDSFIPEIPDEAPSSGGGYTPSVPSTPSNPSVTPGEDQTGEENPGEDQPGAPATFTDVPEGSWYAKDVQKIVEAGIFQGTGDGTFAPAMTFDRAQMATVLMRLAGVEDYTGAASFTDVAAGKYYALAVAWVSENELMTGDGSGTFRPEAGITRQEIVVTIYRLAKMLGYDMSVEGYEMPEFADSEKLSGWASEAMAWAVKNGIINGKNGNLLAPVDTTTRAEMAAMVSRFLDLAKPEA